MKFNTNYILFLLSLQLSSISCHEAIRSKGAEGNSSLLTTRDNKQMAFPQFRLENGKIVSGVMVNSDTVLVLLDPRETTAPETLVVSETSLFRDAQKATRIRGGDYVDPDSFFFENFSKYHHIQIYKLAKKIENIPDIKFSDWDSDRHDRRELRPMKYVAPAEKSPETYDVQVLKSGRNFYIKDTGGIQLKKGGALLDPSGRLLGIVTEVLTQPFKFACGLGPFSAGGLLLSYDGNLDLFEDAKAGFPTHAERQVMKTFKMVINAIISKYSRSTPEQRAKMTLAGLNVSLEMVQNEKLILNIATSKCSLHFNSYSEITFENIRSSDLELGAVYFANRGKTRLKSPEIETLNKIHKCMKNSLPWLPSAESDSIKSFAAALETYAKEQQSPRP